MHRHRRIKLGRFGEALVCLKCNLVWVNQEEFHKSQLLDILGRAAGDTTHPVFTEEEMAILKSMKKEAA